MQLAIVWNPVHTQENNSASQANLNFRREDFNEQCWVVLKRMLDGEKITMKTGLDSGIGDIRRRAKDLIDGKGIPVQRDWAEDEKGKKLKHKWYYIKPEDRLTVAKRIINLIN